MRQVSGSVESGDVHCTRTTTSIRRHANQENEKQDPNPRRKMKLFNVSVLIFPCSFVWVRVYVLQVYCMHVCECIKVTDLRAQPFFSALICPQNPGVAVLRRYW